MYYTKPTGNPRMIPTIETSRLRLRPHRLEDFPAAAAMWADPAVTRFIGGRPLTQEEAWAKFLRYPGHWLLLGFGFWAVEEKTSGQFVGEIGFADFKRDIHPPIRTPEIGWVLAPQVHGRGYATESVLAALEWGRAHLSSSSTVCLIHPDNIASIRVAEKCGYRKSFETTYKAHPTVIFTRPYT